MQSVYYSTALADFYKVSSIIVHPNNLHKDSYLIQITALSAGVLKFALASPEEQGK